MMQPNTFENNKKEFKRNNDNKFQAKQKIKISFNNQTYVPYLTLFNLYPKNWERKNYLYLFKFW